MGKLGKKARKFAKKNLQSVQRNKRLTNSKFKRKASKRNSQDIEEEQERDLIEQSIGRNTGGEENEDASLDAIFSEDDSGMMGDDSDGDGFLPEDSSFAYYTGNESETENFIENCTGRSALSIQNRDINAELLKKKKMLNKVKEKDARFSRFLESYFEKMEESKDEQTNSEDESSHDEVLPMNEDSKHSCVAKQLTSASVDSWCELVKEKHSVPALTCLLNAYRAACLYGCESYSVSGSLLSHGIQKSEIFCKILMFILREADNTFRKLLGISSSSLRKETVLEIKNTTKWKSIQPLIKSYLRSTLLLLNQVTDSEILSFSMSQLRASITFLAAYPSLLGRLVKIAVHLWATGNESLSSHSFLIIRDITSVFSSNYSDYCFVKTYKAYVSHSQSVEPRLLKHIQFLRNSIVELCSLDVQKSSKKAMICLQHVAKILQKAWQTKRKEEVQKITSWQYINCIDLWVAFTSTNIHDYDLQPLLHMIIQIINGFALLFPGPRYLPLRLRCIQWLNHLSSSSGVFIPVTSLVLDVLEYKIGKDGGKPGKAVEPLSAIKLPKHWLKSREFQGECFSSAIELLTEHFTQWSYDISFPELATIPLIYLKKFCELTSSENFGRVLKRFIDQVELNIEFVQRKRDDATFSPKDHQFVESFLQIEKRSGNTSFTHYYKSILNKATSRKLISKPKGLSKLS